MADEVKPEWVNVAQIAQAKQKGAKGKAKGGKAKGDILVLEGGKQKRKQKGTFWF